MTDIVQKINKQIVEAVETAIAAAISINVLPEMEMPSVNVEKPREKNHGDFSCNVAMVLAKTAHMAPRTIATAIVDNIPLNDNYIEKVEIAGPGFINFFISDKWLYDTVKMIMELGDKYGELDYGKGEKVMVEYVSANPTGPLHMGNARGGALGDLIANVLDKAGYDVTKEFYVNDAGNQIEKFALSLELRYLQELNGVDSVEFPEDCYQGVDIIEHAKSYIASELEDLSNKDSDYRKKKLVEYALPVNIENIRTGLKRYGIEFDNWFSELSLHESGEIDETIQIINDNGFTMEKEGALWLKGEMLESEKDEVLIKSNGFKTYFAADLAYHRNKFIKRNFSRVINLLGTDHHAHAVRMKNAMPAMGIDKDKLDLVLFQLVRLMRGGETVRMSKRTGTAVSLNDLLDEIGVDAARFFFNMKTSGSHLDFDLDLAVKQSNENPVFYVQYAHARICSMLRILEEEGIDVKSDICPPLEVLEKKEEKELMRKLALYPQEILISARTLEPGRLTRYVMDVAGAFHSFYNACRVKGEEESIMKARITLVKATLSVIRNVLEVLSITAPEKM
ncbi:MAG: arginine--tRNA ligase [Clostridiales bacterium]|nr:arginine--tRNA ligase [Clostridiales bacterium]